MRTFEITEKEVAAAFREAESGEAKKILAALFCKEEMVKPTLDDYKTIRTYEDACEALDVTPIYSNEKSARAVCEHIGGHWDYRQELPPHILALLKLETISRALWGKNFQPKPDAEGNNVYWYPWFALWTKKEIEDMKPENRGALLSAYASNGAGAGFGYLAAGSRSSNALASIGFRLCQETEEKAKYFGQQFIELWAEYLRFNFKVGNRLK